MDTNPNNADVIELKEVLRVIWSGKKIITIFVTISALIGLIYTLNLPDVYRSYAVLTPTNNDGGGSPLQGYSGLASMAGIKLPSSGQSNKSTEAIQIISSFSFFEDNILPNIHLPDLMAVNYWNKNLNEIQYDNDIYDEAKGVWFAKNENPKPSAQKSFAEFQGLMSVSQDIDTGFVTISVDHESPQIAKEWIEIVINEINIKFRQDDKLTANLSLEFLNKQISNINLSEIKESLYDLIKAEIKKLTLIEANKDYIFKILEPPIAPEKKHGPARSIILIIITFLGFMVGTFYILITHFYKKNS